MKFRSAVALAVVLSSLAWSQSNAGDTAKADAGQKDVVVVPADTQIPLALNHAINGKNAKVGDSIYLVSTFPVAMEDRIVIPVGTYVQGEVAAVKRPGRIHGRGELLVHFTRMILPNGYTLRLAGSLDSAPELEDAKVKGKEGTIQHEPEKGKVAEKVAVPAVYGTFIGLGVHGGKGAAIGAASGGAAGLLWSLLSRGSDVYLPRGTELTMILQRPLTLDRSHLNFSGLPTPVLPPRAVESSSERGRSRLPLPRPGFPY